MAIDMIESNELAALAPSRLGLKQFADDGFKNYTGGEEFFNLFGSRRRKKSAIRDAVVAKYKDLPTDCANIDTSIEMIANDVATLLKQKSNLQQREALDETNIILGQFKNLKVQNRCEQIAAEQKKEAVRADTLKTLTELGDISVQKAQAELQGLQLGDTGVEGAAGVAGTGLDSRKLLIYGGVGLAVLVGIALILRK